MGIDIVGARAAIEKIGVRDGRVLMKPKGELWKVPPYLNEYGFVRMFLKFNEKDGVLLPSDVGRISAVFE